MCCTECGMVSINEQKGGRVYLRKIKKEKKRGWSFPGGCGSMGSLHFTLVNAILVGPI